MLERHSLWLGPWQRLPASAGQPGGTLATAAATRLRVVFEQATGERLGVVRGETGLDWPLLRRLARQVLRVYETEDESLLCVLRRPWSLSRCWEVCDAEGHSVAVVYSRLILDGAGYPLAGIEPPAGGSVGRFIGPDGSELGTFRLAADGTGLTFAAAVEREPFARMALLGAALTQDS